MGVFGNQVLQVLRRLRRAPLFALIILITLAAGIGANTVIFSVLEGVLLKPLPYSHSDALVSVFLSAPSIHFDKAALGPSDYFIFREQSQTFEDIGIYNGDSVTVTGTGEPEHLHAVDVTDGVLPILHISPILGRQFTPADNAGNAPETVMLTYGYWQRKFGGDVSIVGHTIIIDGTQRQIIGVLPQNFDFLDQKPPEVLLPFHFDRSTVHLGNFSYPGIARLRPGATLPQANADVARLLPIVMQSFPTPDGFSLDLFKQVNIQPKLTTLKQEVVGDIGSVLWILMGSIGMVLLIACANVANLLLVRVEGRRQELAIRAALGADWKRIAGDLLLESLILGFMGSLLGLALAWGALQILIAMDPTGLPRLNEISINAPVLLFTFCIMIFTSLLCAAIPIFKYAGSQLNTGLRESSRGASQSKTQLRARNVLVVVQVSLALVLLICSGLMIRTFRALIHVNPGFIEPDKVQTFRISIPDALIPDSQAEQLPRMAEEIERKIASIPGVSSVAASTSVPMDGYNSMDPIFAEDRASKEGELPKLRKFKFVIPGFFSTLGTPLIAGRDFTWSEIYQNVPVAIVSGNLAREYWQNPSSALGKRIRVTPKDDWREVVGVAADMHDEGMNVEAPTIAYWPLLVSHFEGQPFRINRDIVYVIRSPRADSQAFLTELRQAVWSVNGNLPLAEVHTLGYFYMNSMARTSFTLVMLGVASAMALLLGVVGIYGVIAYSVSQRKREIGIRMALGAQQQTVIGMFVRDGLMLTGVGVVCGLVAAFVVMRLMSHLLFHVSPVDPITYVGVSIGVVVVAFVASYLPSRRAATIDPIEALRAE